MQQQAVLAMSLQEQLVLSDDDESDEDGEDEACGGAARDEVYDDGEFNDTAHSHQRSHQLFVNFQIQQHKCSKPT